MSGVFVDRIAQRGPIDLCDDDAPISILDCDELAGSLKIPNQETKLNTDIAMAIGIVGFLT